MRKISARKQAETLFALLKTHMELQTNQQHQTQRGMVPEDQNSSQIPVFHLNHHTLNQLIIAQSILLCHSQSNMKSMGTFINFHFHYPVVCTDCTPIQEVEGSVANLGFSQLGRYY